MQDVNLREMFDAFCEVYAPARELMRGGTLLGELKGAPLRCSLDGARFTRPGLLVTGEAAGSTYSFTGEGIGKAHGDRHAGRARADRPHGAPRSRAMRRARCAHAPTRRRSPRCKPRFDLYERANRVNDHPWLADLLIWRANKSARILRRMSGVLEGDRQPGQPGQRARHRAPVPADPLTASAEVAMCQLLGMNANTPTDVMFCFTGLATRADEHKDGFGIAFFEDRGRAPVRRPPQRARVAGGRAGASATRSRATTSSPTSARPRRAAWRWRTRHPFVRELWGRYWVFAHNGDLKDFHPRLHGAFRPVGDTDSERAFCWLMQELAKAHAARAEHRRADAHAGASCCRSRPRTARFNLLLVQRPGAVGARLDAACIGCSASTRSRTRGWPTRT